MRKKNIISLFLLVLGTAMPVFSSEIPWKTNEIVPGGRIDAIAYAGNNVVIAGTRSPNPGLIFYSTDNGITWQNGNFPVSSEKQTGITCIACGTKGLCYAINESSELFRSMDYGKAWSRICRVSTGANSKGWALSYGLVITAQGTLLVSDTNSDGGYIYRSTDGGLTFARIGPISPKPLYRFEKLRNGIIVNGWEGCLYKTENDGLNWELWCKMDSSALYATEFVRPETIIQASESGNIYTADQDSRNLSKNLGKPGGSADDFAYIGYNTLVYSTYTGTKSVFISYDRGITWIDDGPVPTRSTGDWLDHFIPIEKKDSVIVIGGTNKGFIVRASYARSFLYDKTFNNQKIGYDKSIEKKFEIGLVGELFDPKELDEPEDVFIDGKYAYVPCRVGNNLAVIDISDPQKPVLASSFRDPELIDAMGVTKFGNYVYLASFTNHKCLVLDARNPHNLKKVYAFKVGTDGPTPDRFRKVIYHNGYLYLTHSSEGKLYIADAHDPSRPIIISSIGTGDGAFAVFVKGDYAYVGGCFPGSSVKVINIADKKNPKLVSSLPDSSRYACTCSFQSCKNNLVAIAYSSNSLIEFDISNPAKPVEKGFLQSDQMYGTNRLALIGNKAYVINSINDSFVEVDISPSKNPSINYLVHSWKIKKVYGMAAQNGLLYMVGRDSRYFLVIDPSKY